ncbi:MAG: DUF6125 family protein [Candidatus Odinarchaeota archaeon]
MRKITEADKIFYFEKNFFTMDGVWMLETEKEVGWDTALKIDRAVWIRLMRIFFRRIKRYLKIESNRLEDLVEIITFRWSIEGWKYEVDQISASEVIINIKECPYKAIMDRNPERQELIPLICNNMCFPFYEVVFKEFNPKIKFERVKSLGLGDDSCDFCFKLIE